MLSSSYRFFLNIIFLLSEGSDTASNALWSHPELFHPKPSFFGSSL